MNRSTRVVLAMAAAVVLRPLASGAGVIWEADPKRGLNVFEGLEQPNGSISVATDPKGTRGKVFRYNMVDDADNTKDRVESRGNKLLDGTNFTLKQGDTFFISWWALWDKNVGTQPNKWVALFQMHAYGGPGMGAPLVLRTLGDGMIHLQNNVNGTNDHIWNAPMVHEKWQSFVLHIHLDADPTKGWVELWHNGVQQTFTNGKTRISVPLIDNKGVTFDKLKWGLYRTGSASGNWNAYMSGARIGTTFADVDPSKP
jgi:hypothetical protein